MFSKFSFCPGAAPDAYHTKVYAQIGDLPLARLSEVENRYLQPDFLQAYARAHQAEWDIQYVAVFQGERIVGLALLQGVWVSLNPQSLPKAQALCGVGDWGLRWAYGNETQSFRTWICGNVFLSGQDGIWIASGVDKPAVMRELIYRVQEIVRQDAHEGKAIVFKDLGPAYEGKATPWKEGGYSRLAVEPNMVLHLPATWNTFGDYLAALKSKFRVKAKKALQLSEALTIKDLNPEEIIRYLPQLKRLYKAVEERADFSLGQLNLDAYTGWKARFGADFLLRSFWLKGKMVGYLSGFVNGPQLDAHFVGLDYAFNKEYAIYQRMLYEYVAIGIERKVAKIHFGRTAGEIKSTIGAVPEALYCYVRHARALPNHFVNPLVSQIKPPSFPLRNPFKELGIA